MKTQSNNQFTKVASFYLRHALRYPLYFYGTVLSLPIIILINNYLPAVIAASVLSDLSQHHYSLSVWMSFGPKLIVYSFLIIGGVFVWRINDYFIFRLEGVVQRDIARRVFDHLVNESADFHANNFSGSLVSQTSKLIGGYVRMADTVNYQLLSLATSLVAASVILASRAPLYVAMLDSMAVIFLAVAFILAKPTRALSAKHAAYESKQTGFLADAITNVMAIKSFSRASYERNRFAKSTENTYLSLLKFARAQFTQFNLLGIIVRFIMASALVLAVVSVTKYHANIGTVFLILSFTGTITDQLFTFSNNSLRAFSRATGDAIEMVEILATPPSVLDPDKPEPLAIRQGSIDFDNVTFAHDGGDDALFEKLSLSIKHGEKIGLVGHSGSGKTTFTRLLLRFSDIDDGAITIDGQNIAQISQSDLHSVVAYVPQEALLFHRSIAENIAYGKLDATAVDIELAAKRANAAEFIERLPRGYDTLVGERGVKLSGGQRQRVAIARAMLKDAPILVLDEATSALDSESEVLIQDALWKLMQGRTAIVIAHRLSTIQKMDRIVVLDNGQITEQGTHPDLLKNNGTYAKLWAHQSGGFIED